MKNNRKQSRPARMGMAVIVVVTAACSGKPGHSESLSDEGSVAVETDTSEERDTGADAAVDEKRGNKMNIQIGKNLLSVTLVDNSSVTALKAALSKGPITVEMRDYAGMEKVGDLGMDLPRNDEPVNADAGDVILYQGNALVIYYAPNSWSFTRLGKMDDISSQTLKEVLGDGAVTVTLSLP